MPARYGCVEGAVDTVLFVDVDGVLNTVVVEPCGQPIHFSKTSAERALSRWSSRDGLRPDLRERVEAIVSTYRRRQGHGDSTYAELTSCVDSSLSDVLVQRLAQVVRQAGAGCLVVLASTWRRPEHAERVRLLEEKVSQHLDRPFAFGARTALCEEDGAPETRLRCLGDFLRALCAKGSGGKRLRVLVLEDFHYSPFGWQCGGEVMGCPRDAEQFLLSKIPPNIDASARIVHTYDEWRTPSGLPVRLGAGLTMPLLCEALSFLGGRDACLAPPLRQPARGRTLLEQLPELSSTDVIANGGKWAKSRPRAPSCEAPLRSSSAVWERMAAAANFGHTACVQRCWSATSLGCQRSTKAPLADAGCVAPLVCWVFRCLGLVPLGGKRVQECSPQAVHAVTPAWES